MDESVQKQLEQIGRVGRFQYFADAILRGCQISEPCKESVFRDGRSCAFGALQLGLGIKRPNVFYAPAEMMEDAYHTRYGISIEMDNDGGHFTREEIAARIAAL